MTMHSKSHILDLNGENSDEDKLEYTTVILGRDLSSYVTALLLHQHEHRVAIVSRPQTPIMTDLREYLSLKYLYEAARRFRLIYSLSEKGFRTNTEQTSNTFNWQQLTSEWQQEYFQTKQDIEDAVSSKHIPIYEGIPLMIEENLLRVISEDERTQYVAIPTKHLIVGSEICYSTIRDYSTLITEHSTLKNLTELMNLERLPQSLVVIGGGKLGASVASCLKELGCARVSIIEQQPHCLTGFNDIDREIAAYIESILVKREIDIITNCIAHHITESLVHCTSNPIKSEYQFIAVGTRRKSHTFVNHPSTAIIQLIERVTFGRKVQIGTLVNDGNGGTHITLKTPLIHMDYQNVKSTCSIEQALAIAYRTIGKCLKNPTPRFIMPSFIYTIPPVLFIGRTHVPADDMFICSVSLPPTMKYVIDASPRGFGKFWISRTHPILCGVQLISEHAPMFGKGFGILIRNQRSLEELCYDVQIPGSIGEAMQLMVKQALLKIAKDHYRSRKSFPSK